MKKSIGPARSLQNRWLASTVKVVSAVCLLAPARSHAAPTHEISPEFMQQVLDRLAKDESEIKGLKSELLSRPPPAPVQGTNLPAPPPDSQWQQRLLSDESALKELRLQVDCKEASDQTPKYPTVQFHGFGDFDYAADSRRLPAGATPTPTGVTIVGGKNTFYEGELDLFTTAQLAENISFTVEPVLSAGLDNEMGFDLERTYLEIRDNDYFNIDVGRFHTALGYYSTTYHHGAWLQTAIGRPTVVQFEDSGGFLPIHMTGLSLYGAIPSGKMNLAYRAEIGNGMEFSSNPNQNPIQQVVSFTDSKAVNLALTSRPEGIPGLQFGGGVYYDIITPELAAAPPVNGPTSIPRNNQLIPNAHIVYHNSNWEFLNEFYLVHDQPVIGAAHNNVAFFTQVSRKFGLFTPYLRYSYYDIHASDQLYAYAWAGGVNSGVHSGPSVGLRYDFSNYAALKAQYDYLHDYGVNDASRITLQVSFTF